MELVKNIIEFVMDILETVVFIGSLFIVVYLFIMQPNQVQGASMKPNFHGGDYILTSKITYKFRQPERGDVIVFKSPKNPDIDYIKRVIGLPGETLMIKDGDVYINNQLIPENYTATETNVWQRGFINEEEPITIPQGYLFVMGDNRKNSSDSRMFGPIPMTDVIGYVFYRYYPPNKIGLIKNPLPKPLRSKLSLTKIYHLARRYLFRNLPKHL